MVIVVVDRHADVVQHRGGPQQLALARLALVQAERGQLVEHAQCERRDVLGVRHIHAVLGGDVHDAGAPHVLEQRRHAV